MATLEAKLVLDDGETVEFFIAPDGISRWGNTTAILGRTVEFTERIAKAMAEL